MVGIASALEMRAHAGEPVGGRSVDAGRACRSRPQPAEGWRVFAFDGRFTPMVFASCMSLQAWRVGSFAHRGSSTRADSKIPRNSDRCSTNDEKPRKKDDHVQPEPIPPGGRGKEERVWDYPGYRDQCEHVTARERWRCLRRAVDRPQIHARAGRVLETRIRMPTTFPPESEDVRRHRGPSRAVTAGGSNLRAGGRPLDTPSFERGSSGDRPGAHVLGRGVELSSSPPPFVARWRAT